MVGAGAQCRPRSHPHCPDRSRVPGRGHHRCPWRGQVLPRPDRRGRTWPGRLGASAAQPPDRLTNLLRLPRLPARHGFRSRRMGSPTAILQGITSLIRSDAAGRDCVITLDTTGQIDDMSAGVLLNILLTGTARIIAIAPSTSDLPADFHWLLTDRRLTEVRLDNLNELQTRQVLLTLLGHRVSASLVSTYHAIVGGNPLLLKALVTEQQQSGNLVLSDSVWTLRDKVVLDGATGLDDIVRSRWSRETPETREVIEMLSCARSVDLSRLTEIYGAATVADMEDAGLLTVGDTEAPLGIPAGKVPWGRRPLLAEHLPAPGTADPAAGRHGTRAVHADHGRADGVRRLDAGNARPNSALPWRWPRPRRPCSSLTRGSPSPASRGLKRTDAEWVAGQRHKAAAYLLLDLPLQAMAALDDISQAQLDSARTWRNSPSVVAAKSRVMVWLPELRDKVPGRAGRRAQAAGRCPGVATSWPEPLGAAANRISLDRIRIQGLHRRLRLHDCGAEEAADSGRQQGHGLPDASRHDPDAGPVRGRPGNGRPPADAAGRRAALGRRPHDRTAGEVRDDGLQRAAAGRAVAAVPGPRRPAQGAGGAPAGLPDVRHRTGRRNRLRVLRPRRGGPGFAAVRRGPAGAAPVS